LRSAQQTAFIPTCPATRAARSTSAADGRRPNASPYASVTRSRSSAPASRLTRSANARAIRSVNGLFMSVSAWSGVVVVFRRGVLTDGSGQSSTSSTGSRLDVTFIRYTDRRLWFGVSASNGM
jgi:hypothetical protein